MKKISILLLIILPMVGLAQLKTKSTTKQLKALYGTLSCQTLYSADTTMDIEFRLDLSSLDYEYADYFEMTFPVGFTINSATSILSTAALNPFVGRTVSWGVNNNDGYGDIYASSSDTTVYAIIVNVTIALSVAGNQYVSYTISGDEYSASNPPHNQSGSCVIKSDRCSSTEVQIDLTILPDRYVGETTWKLTGKDGLPVYKSGGPYDTNIVYYEKICVPGGSDLEFVIEDEYGDGICCRYDTGYYILETPCEVIKQGGRFNYEETTSFQAPYSVLNEFNFEKIYSRSLSEVATDVVQNCDGGYTCCGYGENSSNGGQDGKLFKLNAQGAKVWEKNYGGSDNDRFFGLLTTADGGYLLYGQSRDYQYSYSQAFIVRTNNEGDTLWTRRTGTTSDYVYLYDCKELDNGSFVCGGYDNGDGYILKLANTGSVLWEQNLVTPQTQIVQSLVVLADKDLLLAVNRRYGGDDDDLYFYHTDSNGLNPVATGYGGLDDEIPQRLITLHDGNHLACGYYTDNNFFSLGYLLKIDDNGDTLWTRTFAATDSVEYFYDIKETSDHGFLATGNSGVYDTVSSQWIYPLSIVKFDSNGVKLWHQRFRKFDRNSYGMHIANTGDGGCIVAGYSKASDKKNEVYLIRTMPDGKVNLVYQDQEICMVTVDPETGKNLIVWDKVADEGIAQFNIYKETNVAGEYQKIGTVPFDSIPVFVDTASAPAVRANRYKISISNAKGDESELSAHHKTMHLTVNLGQNNANNLIWDYYEGFDFSTYNIYRGSSPKNMSLIATMPSTLTSYTDLNASPLYRSYYQVSVLKSSACDPMRRLKASSGPFSQSISNLEDNRLQTNISENTTAASLSVFPNPYQKQANIQLDLAAASSVYISILSVIGEELVVLENHDLNAGQYAYLFDAGMPGVYYLKAVINGQVTTIKLVKIK